MLNLDEFKLPIAVRCFKSSEGYQMFGPFYPQYIKAVSLHKLNGIIIKTEMAGGDAVCSPIIPNSTPRQIIEAINETWENNFNKRKNVEALISYKSDDWNSVRVVVIEFPEFFKEENI